MLHKLFKPFLTVLAMLGLIGGVVRINTATVPAQAQTESPAAPAARTEPLIIDHATKDITAIPQEWIEAAKQNLHIAYGHTSHGSQITSGMAGLVGFANDQGKGLELPENIFQFNHNSNEGGSTLHLFEGSGYEPGDMELDVGYEGWVQETRDYLGSPNPETGRGIAHPEINVIMWSWCGQAAGFTTPESLTNYYLAPMNQLEQDYPGVTFIYMTGHSNGSGDDPETSQLHRNNQQIRQYAIDNNKVLYDFYDIELYDPDNNYYGDKFVEDDCDYDSNGDGSVDANWCTEWQEAHPISEESREWYSVSCAHSQAINCNQKAYAAWWMWASLAGWNSPDDGPDLSESSKTASSPEVDYNDIVTYTIHIISAEPITNMLRLTDRVPDGLSYIPGSLTTTPAGLGEVDDSNAPTLRWTGNLSNTSSVVITYATTVNISTTATISNRAVIAMDGYPDTVLTSMIFANGQEIFLPLIMR